MLICLDIGNTHIFGGVFISNEIKLRFRYPSKQICTSDLFGIFLRNVLRENNLNPADTNHICLASVVPSLDYSIKSACIKYFSLTPLELKPGVKTGINLKIKNPLEVGSDRIACAVAACDIFPNKNIIIVDFGTATTLCAIAQGNIYLGGAILPGIQTSLSSLCENTAKLSAVDIIKPDAAIGKSTEKNIQSGLYFGQLGAIKEIISRIENSAFTNSKPSIVATGGCSYLFKDENLFTIIEPDLVLHGLRLILEKNEQSQLR